MEAGLKPIAPRRLAGHLDRGAGLRFLAHLMHFASSRADAVDLSGLLVFATAPLRALCVGLV
jgi:hypothetical protein